MQFIGDFAEQILGSYWGIIALVVLAAVIGIAFAALYWLTPTPACTDFNIPEAEKQALSEEIEAAFADVREEATAANLPSAFPLLELAENSVRRRLYKLPGKLVENIPRKMRVGEPEPVEIRISAFDISALIENLVGRGAPHKHDVQVVESMSVRLFAPNGGFEISGVSPDTQIVLHNDNAKASKDHYAQWLWSVTPLRAGQQKLKICISAQVRTTDGLPAHDAMPDQTIEIAVRVNYRRVAERVIVLGGGAITSAILGALVSDKWGEIKGLFSRLLS